MNLNRAQSFVEYALFASVAVVALMGMQIYLKRGLQAKVKTFVDGTAEAVSSMAGRQKPLRQYEPYYMDSEVTTQELEEKKTIYTPGGTTKREYPPAAQDKDGNYVEGNVAKRSGAIHIKGVTYDTLQADDKWEN